MGDYLAAKGIDLLNRDVPVNETSQKRMLLLKQKRKGEGE